MHASTLQGVLDHLRKLTDPARVRELSDADLLERFRLHREEKVGLTRRSTAPASAIAPANCADVSRNGRSAINR